MLIRMKIPNSVAVVTGGASGLGEAIVRMLHNLECQVTIWDKNVTLGESLSNELSTNILFCDVDVTCTDSIQSAISSTLQKFGKINILINSAGIAINQATINPKQVFFIKNFERIMNVNAIGIFDVCRLVSKVMAKQAGDDEKGVIVNISSVAAYEGVRGQVGYASSKGAVNGLIMPMARDLARFKIRVCAVAPGVIEPTRLSPGLSQGFYDRIKLETALNRVGEPYEIAHAVKFLIENTYMNGAVIRIDGGLIGPYI